MTATLTPQDAARLNTQFAAAPPIDIIRWAVETFAPDVALTSSFGTDSAALLHMARGIDPAISVRFVDTGFHFPETLQFKDELVRRWNLNLSVFRTRMDVERFKREHLEMPSEHPDYCCGDSKVEATTRALAGLRCWMTGITRADSPTRATTPFVDVLEGGLVKVTPLAAWSLQQIHAYMREHDIPFHPLWYQGYTSIGCYPCTRKPIDPNDPRSGRWIGLDQTECGIHEIGKSPHQSTR